MKTVPNANDDSRPTQARAAVQTYAAIAGVLLLVSFVAGGFGEAYVPSKLIVSADATATAENIRASVPLFRLGFAGYLVEAVCDIALTLIFYVLLRPVSKDLALLAVFFGLVGTAIFGGAELFYFAASLVLGGAGYLKSFSPDQLNTLALLFLKLYGYGGGLFTVFYGVSWIIRGYLIFRSGYLPKLLGVLLTIGGLGFVARNFALVLAPAYPSGKLLLLLLPGALLLAVWLLIRGVNVAKWEAKPRPPRQAPLGLQRNNGCIVAWKQDQGRASCNPGSCFWCRASWSSAGGIARFSQDEQS